MALQSSLLSKIPGIVHGFGNRAEPVPALFADSWERRAETKQVHGTAIETVLSARQKCAPADGYLSSQPDLPVFVVTADCVPILLARPATAGRPAAVAAVHSGWRGTRAEILSELFKKLSQQGEKASDWIAAIGPAIGPCCYEVSPELAQDFESHFARLGPGLAVPRTRHLDLPAINGALLRSLGVAQVDLIHACTRCSLTAQGQPLYQSYRREGAGTRQYSVIQIKSNP